MMRLNLIFAALGIVSLAHAAVAEVASEPRTQPAAKAATRPARPARAAASRPAATPPAPEKADVPAKRADGAWLAKFNAHVARSAKGGVDVVFLGDMTTEGWAIGGKHGGGARGKKIWAVCYEPINAANYGIRGERTQNVLYRVANGELDGIKPKAVVLQIGINNLASDTPEETAAGVKAIVACIQQKQPETKILLMGIFPIGPKPTSPFRAKINAVNDAIAKLDDAKSVFYFDIGPKLLTPSGELTSDMSDDGVHITPNGYVIWSQAINPKLEELLGRTIEPYKGAPYKDPRAARAPAAKAATSKPAADLAE